MPDGLRVEVDGAVATLTLDRPEALNALTIPLKVALLGALESIAADRSVRAVILTGAGRAFCAGQDLAERDGPDAAPLDVELRERYNPIVRALRSMGQPVIAAVNGVAAGRRRLAGVRLRPADRGARRPVRAGVRADRARAGFGGDVVPAATHRRGTGRRTGPARRSGLRPRRAADRARPPGGAGRRAARRGARAWPTDSRPRRPRPSR